VTHAFAKDVAGWTPKELTMVNEKQRPVSADPDLRMETELEADPMLRLSEGKASPLQIWVVGLVIVATIALVVWALSQPS
jgi:hypothetical protein